MDEQKERRKPRERVEEHCTLNKTTHFTLRKQGEGDLPANARHPGARFVELHTQQTGDTLFYFFLFLSLSLILSRVGYPAQEGFIWSNA